MPVRSHSRPINPISYGGSVTTASMLSSAISDMAARQSPSITIKVICAGQFGRQGDVALNGTGSTTASDDKDGQKYDRAVPRQTLLDFDAVCRTTCAYQRALLGS